MKVIYRCTFSHMFYRRLIVEHDLVHLVSCLTRRVSYLLLEVVTYWQEALEIAIECGAEDLAETDEDQEENTLQLLS